MKYRLAIFNADLPMAPVRHNYGDYADMFKNMFTRAAACYDSSIDFCFSTYNVYKEDIYPSEEELRELDAIAITGSKFCAGDDIPWIKKLTEFMKNIIDNYQNIKVLGICFGHQIIGRAFGSSVVVNPNGWEIAPYELQLTEIGKRVFSKDSLIINQMHKDIVSEVPNGFELLGSTKTCAGQSFLKGRQVLSFQGHPEFSKDVDGLFTEEEFSDAENRLKLNTDTSLLELTVIKFLMGNLIV
ncbi:amidotransferase [Schizosaccharomyces cryophilus OY26]|uniref:Amidotransferase n=1 Tax=Schizosaccharomyces cryophilus (strain OY26 / ATCC MYA-4695 / CBS 11777 / NBRC 106824 / NRRL Y48691) TaxID=653667 RepID=S9WY69_SCHCR|nr:amidotransferase [Schizosaccharomyces cryophilus OY26]EPY49677.1 amidotransferase [Schizosaccharomyces cryophilus OY26]